MGSGNAFLLIILGVVFSFFAIGSLISDTATCIRIHTMNKKSSDFQGTAKYPRRSIVIGSIGLVVGMVLILGTILQTNKEMREAPILIESMVNEYIVATKENNADKQDAVIKNYYAKGNDNTLVDLLEIELNQKIISTHPTAVKCEVTKGRWGQVAVFYDANNGFAGDPVQFSVETNLAATQLKSIYIPA